MRKEPSLPVQFWLRQPLEHALILDVRVDMPLEVLLELYLRIQRERHPELPLPVAIGPNGSRFTIEQIARYQAFEKLLETNRSHPLNDLRRTQFDDPLYMQPLPLDPRRNGLGCLVEVLVSQDGTVNQDPPLTLKTVLLFKHVVRFEDINLSLSSLFNGEQRDEVNVGRTNGGLVALPYAEFQRIWNIVYAMHKGLVIEEQYEIATRIRDGNRYEVGDAVRLRPILRRPWFTGDVEVKTVVKCLDNGRDPRNQDLLLIDRYNCIDPAFSYHYDPYTEEPNV